MASAGRILIIPKGDYNENSTYDNLDLVKYKGTSWLAKKESTGIEPSTENAEYWQKMFDMEDYLSKSSGGTVEGDIRIDRGTEAGNFASYRTQEDGTKTSARFWAGLNGTSAIGSFDENGQVLGQIVVDEETVQYRNGADYVLYGSHNKPRGTYTGDGNEAEHGVNTKGVGSVAMIWSAQGMGFVTPIGGLFVNGSGETVYLTSQAYHFSNGLITLRTSNPLANGSGITYNYQVL